MTPQEDKSILGRNPVTGPVMVALVCGLVGLVLILTSVGAIIGIPLVLVALIAGVVAVVQYRKRSPDENATIPEADRRRA